VNDKATLLTPELATEYHQALAVAADRLEELGHQTAAAALRVITGALDGSALGLDAVVLDRDKEGRPLSAGELTVLGLHAAHLLRGQLAARNLRTVRSGQAVSFPSFMVATEEFVSGEHQAYGSRYSSTSVVQLPQVELRQVYYGSAVQTSVVG
jgi:hypothetical protein